ncbi:MAG: hypothetical protein NC180_00325 [Muribaculaceae bacterium]|nr:hypothetical protein [Roseburia sp.]MCM1431669.1 hypothetical protein [Muribaculaceae bacterium]MCM1491659.1 hypothetical protein [Muribaculaceae bacterium]
MKKKLSLIMIGVAVLLLAGSVAGSARAALTYYSEDYVAQMDIKSIGVSLVENGTAVSWRDYLHQDDAWSQSSGKLLEHMLGENEELAFGKKYEEALSVTNSGTIDEYVRVTVTKYWVDCDASGNATTKKRTDMDPAAIRLHFLENQGWIIDPSASTPERTVLYYNRPLASGESSAALTDTLAIDDSIINAMIAKKNGSGKATATQDYFYNDVQFIVEAEVDAVQTHNAEEAIRSAWGVDVNISDSGILSLQ